MKTPEEKMQDMRAEFAAILADVEQRAMKASASFAEQCCMVDFLKGMARHFDETFDDAVGAMTALSSNLHHLVQSPHGQAALTLLFIQHAGVDLPPMVRRIH